MRQSPGLRSLLHAEPRSRHRACLLETPAPNAKPTAYLPCCGESELVQFSRELAPTPFGCTPASVRVYLICTTELVDEIAEMASQRLPYPVPTKTPAATRIAVLRPKLPSQTELLPLLEEIDQRRWYSNSGPLVTRLEEQLSRHLGFSGQGVITTANATLGLTVALMARRVRAGSVCI